MYLAWLFTLGVFTGLLLYWMYIDKEGPRLMDRGVYADDGQEEKG
jgi:hypothetical protein